MKIPIYYSQDFYLSCRDFGARIICSPGDSLFVKINISNKNVNVVEGNRVKDNKNFNQFINGLNNIDNQSTYELAKNKTSTEFFQFLTDRENKFRSFLNDFKIQNNTSKLFNQFAEDYLKYGTWSALLSYPEWYSKQNNIKKDSVKLSFDYFSFLKQYKMDDTNPISTNHADFLHQYNRYVLQTPKV